MTLSNGNPLYPGRQVRTPRYFQAFGRDYSFSGQTAAAAPLAATPGLGRVTASPHRAPTPNQIREHVQCLYFWSEEMRPNPRRLG
jgi:hypothetical protein